MKITLKPNPLETTVELNEQEQALLWHKLKIKQLEEISYSAYFALRSVNHESKFRSKTPEEGIQEAIQALNPKFIYGKQVGERSKLDEEVDRMLQESLAELKGPHVGDCTSFPVTCGKCVTESLLGINTIPGLDKYSANLIHHAFYTYNSETNQYGPPIKTLMQVIRSLEADANSYSPSIVSG